MASSLPSKDSTADVCCPSAACTACCATCRASVAGCRLGETSPRATVRPARTGVLTAADARRRLVGVAGSTPSRGLTEAAEGAEARRCVMARYRLGTPTFAACAAGQTEHGRFLASAVAISAREGLLQNYESTIFARTAGRNLTNIKPARDYRSQEVASKCGWRI